MARKTPGLRAELEKADWRPSPKTDDPEQCEFQYQPEGWQSPSGSSPGALKKDETPQPPYPRLATPE